MDLTTVAAIGSSSVFFSSAGGLPFKCGKSVYYSTVGLGLMGSYINEVTGASKTST